MRGASGQQPSKSFLGSTFSALTSASTPTARGGGGSSLQEELENAYAALAQRESDLELAGQIGEAVVRDNNSLKEQLRAIGGDFDRTRASLRESAVALTAVEERLQAEERTTSRQRTQLSESRAKIHSLEMEVGTTSHATTSPRGGRASSTARAEHERDLIAAEHARTRTLVDTLTLEAAMAEESDAGWLRRMEEAEVRERRAEKKAELSGKRVEDLEESLATLETKLAESEKRRRKVQRVRKSLDATVAQQRAAERSSGELVAQLEARNEQLARELDEMLATSQARISRQWSPSSPRITMGDALLPSSPLSGRGRGGSSGSGSSPREMQRASSVFARLAAGESLANELGALVGVGAGEDDLRIVGADWQQGSDDGSENDEDDDNDEFEFDEAALLEALAEEEAEEEAAAAAAAAAAAEGTAPPRKQSVFRGNWTPEVHARAPDRFVPDPSSSSTVKVYTKTKKKKKKKKKKMKDEVEVEGSETETKVVVEEEAAAEVVVPELEPEEEEEEEEEADDVPDDVPVVSAAEDSDSASDMAAAMKEEAAAATAVEKETMEEKEVAAETEAEDGEKKAPAESDAAAAPPAAADAAACVPTPEPSLTPPDSKHVATTSVSRRTGPKLPKRPTNDIDLMFFHFTCTMTTVKVQLSRNKAMRDDIAREKYNAIQERTMYTEAIRDNIPFTEWPSWIRSRYLSEYVQALSEYEEKHGGAGGGGGGASALSGAAGRSPVQRVFGWFKR